MATKGIYKRGNIYWVRYAGLDGRIVFESSGSDKFRKAETILIKRRQTIKEGKQPEPIKKMPNLAFSQLAVEYSKWCEKQRSFNSKIYFIRQLTDAFGNVPLNRISVMMIEQFQSEQLNLGKKPATANRLLATLKHCIHKGYQWEMLTEDTLKRVRQVKFLQENNKRLRYLSQDECKALLDVCDAHLKPIVTVALNTGCRKGEILGLKWDNIDLKNGFISLNQSQTKNAERKEVPLNATLKGIFQAITRRLDVPYVFFDHLTGKPYQDVKRSFHTALKNAETEKCTKCDYQKAKDKTQKDIEYCPLCNSEMAVRKGITDFHFHDLRHTFASHLVMAGIDITTIKELLGHKTLTMTLRYAHLAPSHKVKAVDILDKTLTGESTIQKLYNPAVNE